MQTQVRHPHLVDLQKQFEHEYAPHALATSTRRMYARAWAAFSTFCAKHRVSGPLVPTPLKLMQAYCTHLASDCRSASMIRIHVVAILHEHVRSGITPTITRADTRLLHRAFGRKLTIPAQIIFPVDIQHIRQALRLPRTPTSTLRDTVIVVLGTILALRAEQLCAIRLCDLRQGFNPTHPQGLAVSIRGEKNDQYCRGLWPRITPAQNKHLCPIALVAQYIRATKIHRHPQCSHRSRIRCTQCPFLVQPLHTQRDNKAMSTALISQATRRVMMRLHVPTRGFSSRSLRKGGLTIALNAGVEESLCTLQSGHHSVANRIYETNTTRAYAFSSAFNL